MIEYGGRDSTGLMYYDADDSRTPGCTNGCVSSTVLKNGTTVDAYSDGSGNTSYCVDGVCLNEDDVSNPYSFAEFVDQFADGEDVNKRCVILEA